MNLRNASRRLARDTRGANLVEYIMLVGLIAIVCITAFTTFSGKVSDATNNEAKTVGGLGGDGK